MKYLISIFFLTLVLSRLTFGNLVSPKSVAVDKEGYIYIVAGDGTWMFGLFKYDSKGEFEKILNVKLLDISWDSEKQYLSVANELGLRFTRKLTGMHKASYGEIKDIANYLKVKPNVNAIGEKIFYPVYITISSDGRIYGVGHDTGEKMGRVGVIDSGDGHTIMAFGEFTREDKPYGLWNPRGIAVDSEGNIYVANQGPYCVKKFDKNGKFIKRWAPRGSGRGRFKDPMGIAIDKRDNSVYVLDDFIPSGVLGTAGQPEQMRVQKFTKDGRFIKKWGERLGIAWNPFLVIPRLTGIPEIDEPAGITVDSKGFVYVVERSRCRVNKFDSNGRSILQWGKRGKGAGEFDFRVSAEPIGMAVDKDDNIYIADTDNNRIQKFDSNGKFLMEIK